LSLKPHLNSGYLLHAATLAELANKAGIDPAGLKHTIEKFNPNARAGIDPEFGRGASAYNLLHGDPDHQPNACLAPVARAPFYAIRLVPGDIGTFAGLRTNRDAQVLDKGGKVIPGLYAVGNDAASIMGGNYPGSGITLGPAMTFGYLAGKQVAGTR
jgi:succinate dehydrogenase/fumarate reductase flavoprotein subunit